MPPKQNFKPPRPTAPTPPPSSSQAPPPPSPEPRNRLWRYQDEEFDGQFLYDSKPELFTMRVHGEGRFKKYRGIKVYDEGWLKLVDFISSDKLSMSSIARVCGMVGLNDYSLYYYRRPGQCLEAGLVHLKREVDVTLLKIDGRAVNEIDIYVVRIEKTTYREMVLKEMHASFREYFPAPVITEISEEEALELPIFQLVDGKVVEKNALEDSPPCMPLLLGWYGMEEDVDRGGDEDINHGLNDKNLDEVMRDEISKCVGENDSWMEGIQCDSQEFFKNLEDLNDIGFTQDFNPTETPGIESPGIETGGEIVDEIEVDSGGQNGIDEAMGMDTDGHVSDCSEEGQVTGDRAGCYENDEDAEDDLGPVLQQVEYIPDEGDVELFEVLEELEDFELETEVDSVIDPSLRHTIIFNKRRHLHNPVLIPGMVFGTLDEFKLMIRELAVLTQRSLLFKKNDRDRVRAECVVDGCPWVVLCSRLNKGANFSIKTINDIHTCGCATKNKMVSVKYLANKYVAKVRREPAISLNAFIGQVSEELGVEINHVHAWRAIRAAGQLLYGNEVQQFAKLWSYAEELRIAMPGSTIRTKLDNSRFERIYVCLAPLKEGFRAGCRKFVCLDGCFLKGGFKGQLLAAVGCDPDNGIYPIAWAVVEVENTSSWTWFVELLKEDLMMYVDADRWVIMTDQQKGLENAIATELPYAEHRLCVKHLHANWSKRFPGKALKDLMWEASRAANVPYFEVNMEKIKQITVEGYEALRKIPRNKWTRCAFRTKTNCPMLVNNWAEAFNKVILKAREQPILSLLNSIHYTVMQRLQHEHGVKERLQRSICPRVDELIRKREKHCRAYVTRPSGTSKYSVSIDVHGFVVDIATRECSCGLWQLSGVPCIHAVCVYQSHNKDPRDFVHHDFSKSTFLEVYKHFLLPIRGPMNWPKMKYDDILPPTIRVLPGRPKRKRHIDASEAAERAEKEREIRVARNASTGNVLYKARKKGVILRCRKCGVSGHNARTCAKAKDGGSSSQTPSLQ